MNMKITFFQRKVYNACEKIPKGKVSTYQEIGRALRQPKASRAVGNALNATPFAPKVPCHRVVKSDGQVGGYSNGLLKKTKILIQEGDSYQKGQKMNVTPQSSEPTARPVVVASTPPSMMVTPLPQAATNVTPVWDWPVVLISAILAIGFVVLVWCRSHSS